MSVLVHLCESCGHQVGWHEPREQSYTSCRCCRAGVATAVIDPVVIETFTVPGWRPEPLYSPGARRNSGRMHATTTCDCEQCWAAYARLTGQRATG